MRKEDECKNTVFYFVLHFDKNEILDVKQHRQEAKSTFEVWVFIITFRNLKFWEYTNFSFSISFSWLNG
jgi:hypothetical protein